MTQNEPNQTTRPDYQKLFNSLLHDFKFAQIADHKITTSGQNQSATIISINIHQPMDSFTIQSPTRHTDVYITSISRGNHTNHIQSMIFPLIPRLQPFRHWIGRLAGNPNVMSIALANWPFVSPYWSPSRMTRIENIQIATHGIQYQLSKHINHRHFLTMSVSN